MTDLAGIQTDNSQTLDAQNLNQNFGSFWNENNHTTNNDRCTLEDGSVKLTDWSTLTPEKYMLYLLQLMIQNKSSDIYFTYGEEPAIRIFSEISG